MKKLLTVGLALAVFFLATGTASAHWRFGFFTPLPPLVVAPSPPAYYYPWILPAALWLLLRLPSLGSRALGLEVDKLWLAEDLVPRQLTLWSVTLQH